MKKRIKRLGAFLLAGICVFSITLSMAGCSGNKTGNTADKGSSQAGNAGTGSDVGGGGAAGAKGCYVESDLTTPSGLKKLTNLSRLEDNSLAILDIENGMLHISKDEGKNWEGKEIPIVSELVKNQSGDGLEFLANAVAKDGGVFYGFRNWGDEGGDYSPHYYYMQNDGQVQEISLSGGNISQAVFAEDGSLYGADGEGSVYYVDTSNWSARKLFKTDSVFDFALGVCGDRAAAFDTDKAYFGGKDDSQADTSDEILNAQVKKEIESGVLPVLAGGADDKVYLAGQSGIYSHVPGGGVMEQLADGALYTLGEPTRVPKAMLAEEDGSFLIGFEDGLICSYVYDPDMPAVPERQLNVYSLRDNASIRSAIASFRKKNPDVYVKLEIGMDGTDGVTANDAVKNLNTRLLANEGPDLIVLDGMPLDSYMDKGMLTDISDILADIQEEAAYFTNLISAYQKEGAVYAVPLRFQIPVLTGEAEELSGITDLQSLADKVEELQASGKNTVRMVGSSTAEELLKELQFTCGLAWVNDGAVDTDALKEYFTQAKRLYEADQKNLTEELKDAHNRAMQMGSGTSVEEMWNDVWMRSFDILVKSSCFGMGNLSSLEAYPKTMATLKEMKNGALTGLPGQAANVFIPSGITGIASGSKETELAKDFLKELLSTGIQSKDTKDGLPLNKDALESWMVQENTGGTGFGMVEVGGNGNEAVGVDYSYWPTEKQWQELLTLIEELEHPCLTDEVVLDAVESVGENILTGEKSIEDGVNEIAQKINLYFKE